MSESKNKESNLIWLWLLIPVLGALILTVILVLRNKKTEDQNNFAEVKQNESSVNTNNSVVLDTKKEVVKDNSISDYYNSQLNESGGNINNYPFRFNDYGNNVAKLHAAINTKGKRLGYIFTPLVTTEAIPSYNEMTDAILRKISKNKLSASFGNATINNVLALTEMNDGGSGFSSSGLNNNSSNTDVR